MTDESQVVDAAVDGGDSAPTAPAVPPAETPLTGEVSAKKITEQVAENGSTYRLFRRLGGEYVIVKSADVDESSLEEMFAKIQSLEPMQALETVKLQSGEEYRIFKKFDNNYAVYKKVGGEFAEQVASGGFMKVVSIVHDLVHKTN